MGKGEETDLVFVYGTLRKGFPHPMANMLASQAEYLGVASTPGQLYDLGTYPAAMFSEESPYLVTGDIFRINHAEHLIPLLDEYEDYRPDDIENSLYKRILIKASLQKEALIVWGYTYLSTPSSEGLIPTGDYLSYLKRSRS